MRRSIPALLTIAALLFGAEARAGSRSFAATSLVIPMDICYQPAAGNGGTPAAGYCPDPRGTADDGMIKAYGLVYQLIKNNIKVYYIVDPAKATIDAVDLTITSSSATPMAMLDHSVTTGVTTEFMTSTHRSISYRGAPFVVDALDFNAAMTLINNDYKSASPQFKNVNVHVAKQGFTAPVKAVLSTTPPKIALLNIGGAAIGVLNGYLQDAGLYTATSTANYPTIGDIFTDFDNVSDFTSGGLTAGGFSILWVPHWDASLLSSTDRTAVQTAISNFVDAGHPLFAECAGVASFEGSSSALNGSSWSITNTTPGNFMTTAVPNVRGLNTNGLPQTWPRTTPAGEGITFNPTNLTNPLLQVGDFTYQYANNAHTLDWVPNSGQGVAYKTGVQRLIYSAAPSSESAYQNRDIETAMYKDNDPKKGLIIYLGGHSYGSQLSLCSGSVCTPSTQTPGLAGERLVLNSLIFLGQPVTSAELSRSAPVATNNKVYQGTYIDQSTSTASYPPWPGHFRQYPLTNLTSTVTAFDVISADWDASVPTAAARTVFTAVNISNVMTQVSFDAAHVSQLYTPMSMTTANATTAINGIRAGALGGIDHSTSAVIGPSKVAGSSTRPTVAYVGSLDGMLHAIAISGNNAAGQPLTAGQELWAFIPPSQLPKIGVYAGGVDASPQVADAYIDVGSGRRQWRTLLAVTCGTFGGTVDMLDVTDPLNPVYKWTASNTTGQYAMGAAAGAAFGYVQTSNGPLTRVFVATSNGGTAGNGVNVYSLDATTGALVWQWNHLYSRNIVNTNIPVPNDVPGQPAVTERAGDGGLDDRLYLGDNDGRLWEVDTNLKTTPSVALWDASVDGQPIGAPVSLARDDTSKDLLVVFGTAGRDWVPATILPKLVAVDAQKYQIGQTGVGTVKWSNTLPAGERVYAAPTVAGSDVYTYTSIGNITGNIGTTVNDTGIVRRLSVSNGAQAWSATVTKGAGEVNVATDGSLVLAAAKGEARWTPPATGGTTAQGGTQVNPPGARPFVIQAWLDFRY